MNKAPLIRLASTLPVGSAERRILLRMSSSRLVLAFGEVFDDLFDTLDDVLDSWTDVLLDLLSAKQPSDDDIQKAFLSAGVTADTVNALPVSQGMARTAGVLDYITALGGKILKGVWHMLTHPFISFWKLLTSASYRAEIKKGFKKAIRHENRATKHLFSVSLRLSKREEVNPQEIKAAARQFVDLASKILLAKFVGPHIVHLFSKGILHAATALLSPLDEVVAVAIDKPLRWATEKFVGESIGLLPSGFYPPLLT